MFRPLLYVLSFLIQSAVVEASVFSAQYRELLLEEAKSPEETALAQRILGLELSFEDAETVTQRIPFISADKKLSLIEAIRLKRRQLMATGETKPDDSATAIDDQTQDLIRRYLLHIVSSESQFQFVKKLLIREKNPETIIYELRQAEFLTEAQIRQAQSILSGQMVQFANRELKDQSSYAQKAAFQHAAYSRDAEDIPGSDGTRLSYRHAIVSTERLDDREYMADVSVRAGGSIWHPEEDVLLERLRLEFRSRAHHLVLGHQLPQDMSLGLQKGWFGAQWSLFENGGEGQVLAGYLDEGNFLGSDFEREKTWMAGFRYTRSTHNTDLFGFEVLGSRQDRNGGRAGLNLGWFVEKSLARHLGMRAELNLSHGGPRAVREMSDAAGMLQLAYSDGRAFGELSYRRLGRDWFSLSGETGSDSQEILSRIGEVVSWGDWEVELFEARSFVQGLDSKTVRRPAVYTRFVEPMGHKDLLFDIHWLQSDEDVSVGLATEDTKTLHFGLQKQWGRLVSDSSLRLRDMDKSSPLRVQEDRERVVHSGLRYLVPLGNKGLWPGFYYQRQRLDEGGLVLSHRDTMSVDLSTEIFSRTQASLEWQYQKQSAPNLLARQELLRMQMVLEHPFDMSWDKSLEFSLSVEEGKYAGSLFRPSGTEVTVSYHNQF
ncbi:MAG: hypothetical protein H3C47_07320 [Candidatus Cloacimonetes bacterium]|nr:hypothetical protein [Candidatus Cloacimonadota bacterium]